MDNGRFAINDHHSGRLKRPCVSIARPRARLVAVAERIDDVVVYKERVEAFPLMGRRMVIDPAISNVSM
jgi:hypothetical protein